MATWDPASWLEKFEEQWQVKLISEFVEPFRTNQTIVPLGPEGKKITLDNFHPILIITIWDAWSFLWTYAFQPTMKMKLNEQIDYLMESLKRLAESLIIIQPKEQLRPSTVNVTYSVETSRQEGIVVKYMMGASIRCKRSMNKKLAESRMKQMETLQWAKNVKDVLTEEQWENCKHALGNCSESGGSSSIECHTTVHQVQLCDGNDESSSGCNNTLVLVDAFEDKSRVATSCKFKIFDSDPKELTYYIKCIAEFGFNHIIIVGETNGGMVFLDCYGRVFLWNDESLSLWPLGDSPEEASKYTIKGKDRLECFIAFRFLHM
ncbi:hypothetical protein GLOIN_2v1561966 [Rhizophagus irregularis DAOM 181602=DAOM 197198]|nr:hypothetical protein GLOIN_2v1561966 [Rhizophagus irregularis DAOM 181602=DAOM 197198]